MRIPRFPLLVCSILALSFILQANDTIQKAPLEKSMKPIADIVKLPSPKLDRPTSVEQALLKRRSVRDFKPQALELADVSQLLWAAQGITEPEEGFRTAPSAGALYPLEVYLLAEKVSGLPAGVYIYIPKAHELKKVVETNRLRELSSACHGQFLPKNVPAVIVISANYSRTTKKYGERGIRYVHMEAGHAAQNIYLQTVALNLGTFVIGAFDDQQVKRVLELPEKEDPLYVMPIGRPKNK